MLSVANQWALASSAILTRYFLEDPRLLGGLVPSEASATEARELLADNWELASTQAVRETLAALVAGRYEPDSDLGPVWQLASAVFVAGKAFLAGLLDEAEALATGMIAARTLQAMVDSWDQLATAYRRSAASIAMASPTAPSATWRARCCSSTPDRGGCRGTRSSTDLARTASA
ncbi:MAG: DUF1266 domain-containing protein [Kofleriaceae bacterium]